MIVPGEGREYCSALPVLPALIEFFYIKNQLQQ